MHRNKNNEFNLDSSPIFFFNLQQREIPMVFNRPWILRPAVISGGVTSTFLLCPNRQSERPWCTGIQIVAARRRRFFIIRTSRRRTLDVERQRRRFRWVFGGSNTAFPPVFCFSHSLFFFGCCACFFCKNGPETNLFFWGGWGQNNKMGRRGRGD